MLVAFAIPDTPHWVETEMAKIEFKRREIEKGNLKFLFEQNSQSLDFEDKSVQTENVSRSEKFNSAQR